MSMHAVPQLTDAEYMRLKEANKTKSYSKLESFKELYLYQRTCGATKEQIKEIGQIAKRKQKGEPITLPLSEYETK